MTATKSSKPGRTGCVVIAAEKCKACELCAHFCPQNNLGPAEETNARGFHPMRMLDDEGCTGCGICALMCPDACIRVYRR